MMKNIKGFSLVELLVVIGIIGALASVIFPAFNVVRQKGIDARKQMDINEIGNAITLFYDKYGKYPGNYNCYNSTLSPQHTLCPASGYVPYGACESAVNNVPGGTTTNLFPEAYDKSMQELVDAGFMPSIPHGPGGDGYCYYNFGGSIKNAIIMTNLNSTASTTEGVNGSCRPFTGPTWCRSDEANQQYCKCNPY